jgi:F-box protein 9
MSPNAPATTSPTRSNERLRMISNSLEEDSGDAIVQCVVGEKSARQEWSVWHLLPHLERKRIASDYGMSVGQYEEFVSLQQAMGNSLATSRCATSESFTHDAQKSKPTASIIEEEEEEDDLPPLPPSSPYDKSCECSTNIIEDDIKEKRTEDRGSSSLFLDMIPEELIHKILAFLTVDTYEICGQVCSLLERITITEVSYKIRCERIYTAQTRSRGMMRMERWNNSFRFMWRNRPRVRTGGGIYVLKYSHIKPIQRDMWTEVP